MPAWGDFSKQAIYTDCESFPNYIRVTEPFWRLARPDYGFKIASNVIGLASSEDDNGQPLLPQSEIFP
jgi:hypothetical protein